MCDPSGLSWETIRPSPPPGKRPPPVKLLRQAAGVAPAFEPFFRSAGAADEPILLVVNDPHRSTQTRATLRALAEFTHARQPGVYFRAVVATGTHQFSMAERQAFEATTFGETGLKLDDVAWHDATADHTLIELGGVRFNERVARSRFLLPIGSVEPHYFAGVTGAHKTVTIGCLSRADIERNHAGALDPGSDVLQLRGNPVYDGVALVLGALRNAGKSICAVNQVVHGHELVAAAVGDPLETLEVLLPTVRRLYVRTVPQPADLLHLRVPPPLGRSLYQTDKALKNNQRAVRDGGGILLEAECAEGIGPDAFMDRLRRAPDYATACRVVAQEGYRLGDHKAIKLRHLTDPAQRNVRVALVSPHVASQDAETAGLRVFDSVAPALEWLTTNMAAPLRRGLVIEDAGFLSVNSP